MPLRGKGHSDLVGDEAPYFKSLAELDAWFAQPHAKLSGVLPYRPRPSIDGQSDDTRGKLLVCHDYKGGYSESPSALCYTFNFWPLCDTFVYFSHNRITVPPSGWTNTAHRHGTMMLGTLIFEGRDSQPDCLRLVVGLANCVVTDNRVPISDRYAVSLAELAHQRGFDGYLLNFEADLPHKTDHARALASWILLLRAELRAKVGSHAQVVWYDSVIYNGRVSHQNRLNGYNLPFFLASDAFFTNYWWLPKTQDSMARYLRNLNRSAFDPNPSTDGTSLVGAKTLQSIYSGVDVWPGRGQYGNSGFSCYRAITYTSPRGFSTAIFAPGWTWEFETEEPERNWNEWWNNERRLWLGPLRPGDSVPVPDSPEGLFKPMAAFFQDLPHPNPFNFTFYTRFSPGVGYSWFVEGKKVLDTKEGWTDVDKQSSIGNLAWPWPTLSWQGVQREEANLTASAILDMTDGYNGGNTLKLTLTYAGDTSKDTAKLVWLPVQSLAVTTQESFEARIIYKTMTSDDVDLDSHIYVKPLSKEEGDDDVAYLSVSQAVASDLPQGWTQQTINFASASSRNIASVAIGFLVGFQPKDPFVIVSFSLSLGQLAVYPTPPLPSSSAGTPCVSGAKFAPISHAAAAAPNPSHTVEGVLTWDTASIFDPIIVQVDDEESTTPAWPLHDMPAYHFLYFNIYAASLDHHSAHNADPASAVFIGTTGLDGRANRFYVEQACFPPGWVERTLVRFYVQGVTDRGEVLPWERCAIVDHTRKNVA